jgi:hypothetical protein
MKKVFSIILFLIATTTVFAQVQYGPNVDVSITGQAAQTATINNIIPATASANATLVTQYRSATLQVQSTGTGGNYILEGSNNNVTFQPIPMYNSALVVPVPIITAVTPTASSIIYVFGINVNYIRLRINTTITGGSIQSFIKLSTAPLSTTTTVVANGTAANLLTTVSGTVTATGVVGSAASSAASSGNPVRVGGRIAPATPDLTYVAGDAAELDISTGGQQIVKQYSTSERDYNFLGSITNSTTPVVFKNAAGASIRNYMTSFNFSCDVLGAATELVIKDGALTSTSVAANVITSAAHDYKIGDQVVFSSIGSFTGIVVGTPYYVLTVPSTTTYTLSAVPNGTTLTVGGTGSPVSNRVLYRTKLQTTSLPENDNPFPTPLRGMPNATLSIETTTATVTGTVFYMVQGYIGF